MKISEIIKNKKQPILSFEIFPPKPESPIESLYKTIEELKSLQPDFISVTYGAGGSTRDRTLEIATKVKNEYGIEVLMHLTCVGASKTEIQEILQQAKENRIYNILALRGDLPKDWDPTDSIDRFSYASDLVQYISQQNLFSIAGACYPEKHMEAANMEEDMKHLEYKIQQGLDFLITQLFFDNASFYAFMEMLREKGIQIPVFAGIMPVTNKKQIERIISLSGASVPKALQDILEKYDGESFEKAGIAYAQEQIADLLKNGVEGIHLYTMNKSYIARQIKESCF